MTRLAKSLLLAAIISLAFIITACSSRFTAGGVNKTTSPPATGSFPMPANGPVQATTMGAVTIDVEWVKTQAEPNSLTFNVAMDTHSVNLDQYDLSKLAVLRDDSGQEYRPLSWDSAPGGHHRQGRLTFTYPDSLKQGKTKYLEMVIRNIAGVAERVLRWEL